MAHAGSVDGIKTAVRNGVRSIDHGDFLDQEAIELMLARGTWLVPTLIAGRGVLEAAAAGAVPPHMVEKAHLVVDAHRTSMRMAIAAGVKVAFGTDSGVTRHGRNLEELALMVECGMTPAAALHSATLSAARLLGVDADLGSVQPGKVADLTVVEGDAADIRTLADRIRAVYRFGTRVAPNRP